MKWASSVKALIQAGEHPFQKCYLKKLSFSSRNLSSSAENNNLQARGLYLTNKRITHLIRTGQIDAAKTLFDEIKHKNTVTWNIMISGRVKRREMAKARKLFDEMPERDVVSWNLMILGYASCYGKRFLDEGRQLFDKMPERDFFSWNTMISGYARIGKIDEAFFLFNSMPERNVVSWNAMISGFLQNGDVQSAIVIFKRMPEQDSASISALVSGLIKNGELDEASTMLLQYKKKVGNEGDLVHAYNTLIAGYGERGRIEDARKLFDELQCYDNDGKDGGRLRRDAVSWNSMIMCYVKAGDIISAKELFDHMTERDTITWNTMISGFVHLSDMEEASNIFYKMPNPDTVSWNAMISGYARLGRLEIAGDLFERMPQKNLVSWNSMITGFKKHKDWRGAIELFIRMQAEGERPDWHTLSSVLSVCAGFVVLKLGMQIHQQIVKLLIADVPINNSLVTMYSRCGAIDEAWSIFNEMGSKKDVISWNAMIGGYASHGFALEALELFELMKRVRVNPTYITFTAVLNACAHSGLVNEGWMYFKSMVSEFGIRPRVEHFASLVYIVGRHGKLEEAMNLIRSMPMEPDKAVWGALLGASRMYNNVELARVAAEALMKMEPDDSAPYILLYNMYADGEQWDCAMEVRKMMERNNIKKSRGSSWVGSPNC